MASSVDTFDFAAAYAELASGIAELDALVKEYSEAADLPPPLVDATNDEATGANEEDKKENEEERQSMLAGEVDPQVNEDVQAMVQIFEQHILHQQPLPELESDFANEAVDPQMLWDLEAIFWAGVAMAGKY